MDENQIQTNPQANPLFPPVVETKPAGPAFLQPKDEKDEKHVITDEDRDHHVKSVRDLVQQLHNRNDQDTNRVLDNITKHLDALDGNPEQRKAEALEAGQNRKATEKREAREKAKAAAEAKGEKVVA